jgi:hypothetical protein
MRLLVLALLASVAACTGAGEGIEPAKMPPELQGDYAVFARRCSKCHSLARPLQSGIDSDQFWTHYVARMRAMPGSGISSADEAQILRFLHYYSAEQRRKKAEEGK